jgi:hypothetical protein
MVRDWRQAIAGGHGRADNSEYAVQPTNWWANPAIADDKELIKMPYLSLH